MKHRKIKISILLSSILLLGIFSLFQVSYLSMFIIQDKNNDVLNLKFSDVDYTNATVISDGFNDIYWNVGTSKNPAIIIDDSGKTHVVWEDGTDGVWGSDVEIMYATYTEATGWSNVSIISDGFNGVYWNMRTSAEPDIGIDSLGNVHVVWYDDTNGPWGGGASDYEIMYTKYTEATGWSNITIISDGYGGIYWNDDTSARPSIVVDKIDNIHVVWDDNTNGAWGIDSEIMYANYTEATGWSNVSIISDGYNSIYWNDGSSVDPDITIDSLGNIHVVWYDNTVGVWGGGGDTEIMYASYIEATGWSNITIISDGLNDIYWNDDTSARPSIAIDRNDNIHVVWEDWTYGVWGGGTDTEIMYTSYSEDTGWSFPEVISDGFNNVYWNTGFSLNPSIAVDGLGNVHVVWYDNTVGGWGGGTDVEIMYTSYSENTGWILPKVISDRYSGVNWNDDDSYYPSIAYGNEEMHVVWSDWTDGVWGTDVEIMYSSVSVDLNPTDFELSTNAGNPDSDGVFGLLWTESGGAYNYSAYHYSSYISEINSSVTLIQDGLTIPSLILTGYTNGTYYIVVEAVNEFGSTLSNCISVEVLLPYVPQVLQTPSGFSIPFSNFYLVISILGIIYLIVHIKRKL